MSQISTVTFTSEYGQLSPYVAVIKGRILLENPETQLIEITHNLKPGDILGAAYMLSTGTSFYPENAIHLVSVAFNLNKFPQLLIIPTPHGFLVTADNGIASLIMKNVAYPVWVFKQELISFSHVFPDKDIFPFIVRHLSANKPLNEIAVLGNVETELGTLSPSVNGNMLKGQIVFIDGYENAITDIHRTDFDKMLAQYSSYTIMYQRRSSIKQLSTNYDDERRGDTIALFNSFGYLEIAMKQAQASSLIGFITGEKILIEFND